MPHRVVITGMGALTPLGLSVADSWRAAVAGESGIAPLESFDAAALDVRFGGEVRGFDPSQYLDRREVRRTDRFVQLAIAAADEAMNDAGLAKGDYDANRAGVSCGTGIGGIETLTEQHKTLLERGPQRVSPLFIPMMIANMAAAQVAIRFDMRGPNMTTVTACASSAHALGEAFRRVQYGEADVMLAGGAEAVLLPLCFAGFINMKALSQRNDDPATASRPFDLERDGFVMGEGAGMLVFEERERALARGAHIYAEVVGYGMTADAYHIVEPAPDGDGAARAMRAALRDAGLPPESIGYINAHATGTPKGDTGEARAVHQVFGAHAAKLAVSSTKSMTGHLLGAAGAVEAIFTVLALHEGVLPPTINLHHLDPEVDLDCVPNEARKQTVDAALTNSFGFGGQNVTLALRRTDA
ncbi:MAG: beta-ketoacyl-ACP synthase II [Thermaerobacter sp.]|nr:beta-ketoacyl-ACP synthase II [Thermaerobacter sp.]